jgi:hypothetical protein
MSCIGSFAVLVRFAAASPISDSQINRESSRMPGSIDMERPERRTVPEGRHRQSSIQAVSRECA